MVAKPHSALAIALTIALATSTVHAANEPPPELPPPPTWKGDQIDVVEKLGHQVPLDARFRTHDGTVVTLRDVLGTGELPTILTFNYADCPMLCSLQLNGFTAALPQIMERSAMTVAGIAADRDVAFAIGEQFRIVTVSLEPNEDLGRLAKMRQKYLERLPEPTRAKAASGWTFLAAETRGDSSQIRRIADATGFKYLYLDKKAEWAHPAALIFLSARGVVTRYVYGVEYDAPTLRESIVKAGLAEPTTATGFMHRCYVYDPDENNHSRQAVLALRIGAAGTVVLLVGGFGFLMFRRARRSAGAGASTVKEPQL